MPVARGKGRRVGQERGVDGYTLSVWKDERVLEMDGGDGCTTVRMYFMPLNCPPKMVKG